MSTAAPTRYESPHYRFDPQETRDQFRARQQRAYGAGRRAWRERQIKAQLLPFYEALVGYVGQNQYAWVKEQTLADEFAVHVATIKRWLAKLEDAGLIRRQRRFATSSLTYITAYDRVLEDSRNTDNLHKIQKRTAEKTDYRQNTSASDGSKIAPTFGADSLPDSIKADHLIDGSGGVPQAEDQTPDATAAVLQREGIADYYLLPAIQHKSLVELQAISAYLDRQRNVRDRRRLFAWLASRDFGAQLVSRRAHSASGRHAAARHRRHPVRPAAHLVAPTGEYADKPTIGIIDALRGTWERVLAHLQHVVPPDVFATWLADTALLALDDRAVVGTPHVFARDVLLAEYLPLVQQAVQAVVQRFVDVVVVIDSSPGHATPGNLYRDAPTGAGLSSRSARAAS